MRAPRRAVVDGYKSGHFWDMNSYQVTLECGHKMPTTGKGGAMPKACGCAECLKIKIADRPENRRKAFMEATRGLTAHQVSTVMNKLTPGINWHGCSKGDMAGSFASENGHYQVLSETSITDIVKLLPPRKERK